MRISLNSGGLLERGNWLTGGAHVIALMLGIQANSRVVWPYVLGFMAMTSFAAWISNYRRLRQIADTPTSKILSAAQGYVELHGTGVEVNGNPLFSRLTSQRCLWFRHEVHKKSSDDKWRLEDSARSDKPFLLKDGTGTCAIDPDGADVVCGRRKSWTEGNRRYTEWLLLPGDRIYAIGDFSTVGGPNATLDLKSDISTLLADWKKDKADLHRRFDLDGSGTLDMKEWELARRQAKREVAARHAEIRSRDGTHVLCQPRDGRLFLISDYLPDKLIARYRLWTATHVLIFIAATAAVAAIVSHG